MSVFAFSLCKYVTSGFPSVILISHCCNHIGCRFTGGKAVTMIPNWKVDPRCPNASNPFHMCAQYCFDHLNEATQTSTTKSGVFFWSPWNCKQCAYKIHNIAVRVNGLWMIYLCFAIYLFISDKKKGKAVSKEMERQINPDCANASNPYHKCGEHCKRKGW